MRLQGNTRHTDETSQYFVVKTARSCWLTFPHADVAALDFGCFIPFLSSANSSARPHVLKQNSNSVMILCQIVV